jgi:uncharacterized membrane protein
LDQPRVPGPSLRPNVDAETFGSVVERVARFLGTGRYLVYQSIFIIAWLLWNIFAPENLRFDPYTFTFLTLLLSLQASYAAPLILLAQNRQDDRDRVNMGQDRDQNSRLLADAEYLTREVASLRISLGEVVTRDYLRAELRSFLDELDQADQSDDESRGDRGTKRTDKPRTDKQRTDKQRTDKQRTDKQRADRIRAEKARSEKPRPEQPRSEQPRPESVRTDKPRVGRTRTERSRAEVAANAGASNANGANANEPADAGSTEPAGAADHPDV